MSDFIIDPLEVAKTYQFEIETLDDPADVAIQGGKALRTLEEMRNDIFCEGRSIHVHAFGAYVLKHWLQDEQRYVSLSFGDIVASGKSGGISFIQNLGNPQLKTIFLAVRDSEILEKQYGEEDRIISTLKAPTLVVPILSVDTVEVAA